MSQKLPTGNFRWMSNEEIEVFDVQKTAHDGDFCYILEVI